MRTTWVDFLIDCRPLAVYAKRYLVLGGNSRIRVYIVTHEQSNRLPYRYFAIVLDERIICITGSKGTALNLARRAKRFIREYKTSLKEINSLFSILSKYGDENRRLLSILSKHW